MQRREASPAGVSGADGPSRVARSGGARANEADFAAALGFVPSAAGDAPVQRKPAAAVQRREAAGAAGGERPVVRVTASRLNIRTAPDSSSRDNILGQYVRDTEVPVHGRAGAWIQVRYHDQTAFIHGGYVEMVSAPPAPAPADSRASGGGQQGEGNASGGNASGGNAGGGDLGAQLGETAAAVGEWIGETASDFVDWLSSLISGPDSETRTPTDPEAPDSRARERRPADPTATTPDGEADAPPQPTVENNAVLRLAHDFNNIAVWNAGETAPEHEPAAHHQTPYLMNTVPECDEAATIKGLVIQPGRPHAGKRVGQVAGLAFIGKGTPDQIQIVSQAVIDHGLATPATIQAYVDNGRQRTTSRKNGRWGVDCSGFTSQMMHELEGNGREGFRSTNAASYKVGGDRGYDPINPRTARMGDVISYNEGRHVVVIFDQRAVQIPQAGDPSQTREAIKISVAESSGSGRVLTNDRFYYFPDATRVIGRGNPDGPTYTLAKTRSETLPTWQPALATVSYAGGPSWDANYTLNCAGDSGGTNLRVRSASGRFTMLSEKIPNGAAGVELKEVEGDMVRVRYDGQDTRDGQELWAPVRYVASAQAGCTIPRQSGFSAATYSVVRNPNLDEPEQPADGGDAQADPGGAGGGE